MHTPHRGRRALALAAVVTAATAVAAGTADATASASSRPPIALRVRQRTLFIDGSAAGERITLRVPAATPDLLTVDLGDDGTSDAQASRAAFDRIVLRAGDGDDAVRVDETAGVGLVFTDVVPTTLGGGRGADQLLGGSGAEQFSGGPGNDVIDGNRGNDAATMGIGDDEFIWDPGDGSDTIEGRAGADLMTFNGAGANETFVAAPNGERLRLTRNVGNIVMDTDSVERVVVNALGGSDLVEVDDLSATDVTAVDADLGATIGAAAPDGVNDSVFVDGTSRGDLIDIAGAAGAVTIAGPATTVTIADADTTDRLLVSSQGGDDVVDAIDLGAGSPHLDVLAGDGDDTVLGGSGDDTVLAGEGNDFVDGNRGNDTGDLEGGDDEFLWDPGDGSDIVEGREGDDLMTFNGSSGDEIFAASPIGERLAFTRNLGNIFMDTNDVERIDLNTLAGVDTLTVEDVTGTALTALVADLGLTLGADGGDGAADSITVRGTAGDDAIAVTGADRAVSVTGLSAGVELTDAEGGDTLTIAGNGGVDAVDSSGLAPGTVQFLVS